MLLTVLAATYIGVKQYKINKRLTELNDYVAVSAVPGDGVIELHNVGKSNLYFHGYSIGDKKLMFEKERLLSVETGRTSYYWLPVPAKEDFDSLDSFEFTLYLTDQFNKKYVASFGGDRKNVEGDKWYIRVWTYKTEVKNWE